MTTHVGIIGGGQLGMLLCQAARHLELETTVLTPLRTDPAASCCDHLIPGRLDDVEAAAKLVRAADVITFEIESVAPQVLRYLGSAEQLGHARVAPSPAVLLLLQNKALQKDWLERNGFPTAPHVSVSAEDIDADQLVSRFGLPFVQKAQRGGYDGRGVQIIRDAEDLSALWPTPSMFEPFIPNVRELAVLVARDLGGKTAIYDPVDLGFNAEQNILETVIAPAQVEEQIATDAARIAQGVIEKLDGVGLFAIEFFLTEEDELLINEISPRVHNAGHHTLEACETSQFEQHLRAISGLPLGRVSLRRPAVMRNLLYTPDLEPLCTWGPKTVADDQSHSYVHWYGKHDPRPYRKMGHITCLGETAQEALELAKAVRARLPGLAACGAPA